MKSLLYVEPAERELRCLEIKFLYKGQPAFPEEVRHQEWRLYASLAPRFRVHAGSILVTLLLFSADIRY